MVAGVSLGIFTELVAVRDHALRHRIADQVVPVSPGSVDSIHDGHTVFLTGRTSSGGWLEDPEFQIRFAAIKVRRVVERYQWEETALADGETGYSRRWDSKRIDSSRFSTPDGHENPQTPIPHGPWTAVARDVSLGSFQLSTDLVRDLEEFEPRLPDTAIPPPGWIRHGQTLFRGDTPAEPSVGDLRMVFEQVPHGTVSVLALQQGLTLQPLTGIRGNLPHIRRGQHALADMLPPVPPPAWRKEGLMRLATLGMLVSGVFLFTRSLGRHRPRSIPRPRTGLLTTAALLQILPAAVVWMFRSPVAGLALLIPALLLAVWTCWTILSPRFRTS